MDTSLLPRDYDIQITDGLRTLLGFTLGLALMSIYIQFSLVNSYDFEIMRRGVQDLVSGVNPWIFETTPSGFYNPPFSALFLWPLLFLSPQALQVLGGALLFAVIFYQKAWVAIAWFFTNSVLWVMGMGGIDMYVMGAGLLLLFAGDRLYDTRRGLILRTLGYGYLMVKPQGGIFIAGLYFVTRRDWKGLLLSTIVYGGGFITLYPAWVEYIMEGPLVTPVTISHSVWAGFGPGVAVAMAVLVIASRRWQYWQLGGALAGILVPYGMPALPFFLCLTAVRSLAAIPAVIIFSGGLAALTWLATPPPGISDFPLFIKPFLDVYNLGVFGLALTLACLTHPDYGQKIGVIAVNNILKRYTWAKLKRLVWNQRPNSTDTRG